MRGKRLMAAPAAVADPPAEGATLETRRGMSPVLRGVLLTAIVVGYALVAALVALAAYRGGNYPSGADTMFYVHRGNLLYQSITREGNWFPLLDMAWYNGVQTWRYWSPLSAYILAGCQGVMGGDPYLGYLLWMALACFSGAVAWLVIGCTHRRPWMGAFLGLIWFFVPNNLFMLYTEGVVARSMSMPVLPIFFSALYDYFTRPTQRRWRTLPVLTVSFLFIVMCHLGWAGMLAITVLLFLLFYRLTQRKQEGRVAAWPVLVCLVLGFLLSGLWALPSLLGGITSKDSSEIMLQYFQSLNLTINPLSGLSQGCWNRWDCYDGSAYFGFAAFLLSVFGLLFSRRTTVPGFATALSICLLTSTAAYPILVKLPGAQYLWMLRFLSIALTVLLVSFLLWSSLKKGWQALFALLLAVEACLALGLIVGPNTGQSPRERYDAVAETTLIDVGKSVTTQRFSAVEPFSSVPDAIYVSAGYGEDAVPTSYGQGIQAAPNFTNIIQVNQAAQDGQFLYLFDRLLEMGNDTVLVPYAKLDPRYQNAEELDAAARQVGYSLLESNDDYRLYHLDAAPEGAFGVVSTYRAAAIGSDAGTIALGFPAVEELEGVVLDEYSYDELKDYDVLYLAGFTYQSKTTAEQLVLDLSESGTRVLILADGIPDEEHTGSKTFLGVSCNRVNFQNGYPALDTIDGVLYCDLFPSGYAKDWQTVYVNGLDEVWGTITDVPEGKMDFYGTVKNDNIVVVGLALTYHYSLTQDAAVGRLLSHALTLDPGELPQREIVPLEVDYHDNVITIDSPRDNVNTTLSYHDIFRADRPIRESHHLTVVDAGRTTIRLVYPYFLPGLLLTLSGVLLTAGYLIWMKKRLKAAAKQEREAAEPPEAPAEPPREEPSATE